MKKILTVTIAFITIMNMQIGISQSKLDTLQNERLTTIEAKVKTHEELKTTIENWGKIIVVLLGVAGFTIVTVILTTKRLIQQKQAEVIQKTTEEILKNMSAQLGMPLEQVRKILEASDVEGKIKSKKVVVFNSDGKQEKSIIEGLKNFSNKPDFKDIRLPLDINGFDVAILYMIDQASDTDEQKESLRALTFQALSELDGKIDILISIKQGIVEFDRAKYKSKIQYANDPQRFEANIKSLFV